MCVLDILLFNFFPFLIILIFCHHKEHARVPWEEKNSGSAYLFWMYLYYVVFKHFSYVHFFQLWNKNREEKYSKKLKKQYKMTACQGEVRARWQ